MKGRVENYKMMSVFLFPLSFSFGTFLIYRPQISSGFVTCPYSDIPYVFTLYKFSVHAHAVSGLVYSFLGVWGLIRNVFK